MASLPGHSDELGNHVFPVRGQGSRVIGYRAHPFTYLIGKLLVRVPHLGMANLLLPDNPPNPEFLQGRATGMRLAEEIRKSS